MQTAPLLAAKDVQVVELHTLMKTANRTMEEAFRAAKLMLAGPIRDDETETSSQTGREGVASRGELGSARMGSAMSTAKGVGTGAGTPRSRGSSAAHGSEMGRYDHEKVMQTQVVLLQTVTEELKARLVDEQTKVIEVRRTPTATPAPKARGRARAHTPAPDVATGSSQHLSVR